MFNKHLLSSNNQSSKNPFKSKRLNKPNPLPKKLPLNKNQSKVNKANKSPLRENKDPEATTETEETTKDQDKTEVPDKTEVQESTNQERANLIQKKADPKEKEDINQTDKDQTTSPRMLHKSNMRKIPIHHSKKNKPSETSKEKKSEPLKMKDSQSSENQSQKPKKVKKPGTNTLTEEKIVMIIKITDLNRKLKTHIYLKNIKIKYEFKSHKMKEEFPVSLISIDEKKMYCL